MILRIVAWSVVAAVGMLGLSQTVSKGSGFPPVYIAQALSPYLFGAMAPFALVCLARRDLPLGLAAATTTLPLLVLAGPLLRPTTLPPADPASPQLTVLSANVLYRNGSLDDAATMLVGEGADVLVVSELTEDVETALADAGIDDRYPYRASTPEHWRVGLGLWSSKPILSSQLLPVLGRMTVEAMIDVDGTTMRIVGAHPSQPIATAGRHQWRSELRLIREAVLATEGVPSALVGDLNASYWHPPYREMLDAGLIDVHVAMGDAFSRSWPAGHWWVPTFVRIDHVLVTPGMTATAIRDVHVPGSDHVAFEVTLALASED